MNSLCIRSTRGNEVPVMLLDQCKNDLINSVLHDKVNAICIGNRYRLCISSELNRSYIIYLTVPVFY